MMKRWIICVSLAMILVLIGCDSAKELKYEEVYSGVMGDDTAMIASVGEGPRLMTEDQEISTFFDDYFATRQIQVATIENAAVLWIRIPVESNEVEIYSVGEIKKTDDKLAVQIRRTATAKVDPVEGFDGKFAWVSVIRLNSKDVSKNMVIEIIRDDLGIND